VDWREELEELPLVKDLLVLFGLVVREESIENLHEKRREREKESRDLVTGRAQNTFVKGHFINTKQQFFLHVFLYYVNVFECSIYVVDVC
jgi:hypothetical protein